VKKKERKKMVETEAYRVRKQGAFIRQGKQGYMIYYFERRFKAVRPLDKGDTVIEAETEEELEIAIKKHEAELRRFKPLDVLRLSDVVVGKITSRAADSEKMIFFSYKDDQGNQMHNKNLLESYTFKEGEEGYEANFVELTTKNRVTLAHIEKKKKEIVVLESEIASLKEHFEKPVTWERLEKAGGKA
jgi:hypothetical protein